MGRKQHRKQLLAALLAAATVTSTAAAFTDTQGHWAQEAIAKWSEEYQFITGYDDGTFQPDASITRGAFAGILDRFLKFRAVAPAETFTDTAGTYWEEAILKLNASGVYLGNAGKALSGQPITRQQAVTMIARAFQIEPTVASVSYTDADQLAEYAVGYVGEMTLRGYITDSADGHFRPTENITRAEIVNILNNMVDRLIQTSGTYTDSVEGTLMINAPEGAGLENLTVTGDLIIAPGVTQSVSLKKVTVKGSIRNFSGIEPTVVEPETPKPVNPADYPWIEPYGYQSYDNYKVPLYDGVATNTLINGDFIWENGRLVYTGSQYRTRFGIDVSAYQNRSSPNNTIDWNAVAGDGVEFAMVRIGLRGTSEGTLRTDAFYAENIDGAMAAGLDTGVYFFSQAISVEEAVEEADYVISLLQGHAISGPVAYDWEMHDSSYRVYGTEPAVATACALAFCKRIEAAGYQPMVYVSKYVGYNKFNLPQLAQYPIWFPEYKSEASEKVFPAFYYQVNCWQYSSSATINGIGGHVDVDLQFLKR